MTPPQTNGQPEKTVTYRLTVVSTNIGKFVGMFLAIREAGQDHVDNSVLAIAALLILGSTVAEDILVRTIDRFFGRDK
jgi:ABC-type antimicrobial peptide transport system permease subunit